MSIPKVIHYCWFGHGEMPELTKKCIKSWKMYCPDYELIEWNEENYLISDAPLYVRQAYDAKKWAFVSDYVRLDVVYRFGGIYLDTDVEILKTWDPLLENDAFFGIELDKYISTGLGFGATKRHPVLLEIMEQYYSVSFVRTDGSLDLTPCPERNTEVFLRHGLIQQDIEQTICNCRILPSTYLNPKNYFTGKTKITTDTYSIHHYSASWKTLEQKMMQTEYLRFTNLFGERYGELLYQAYKTLQTQGFPATVKKISSHLFR